MFSEGNSCQRSAVNSKLNCGSTTGSDRAKTVPERACQATIQRETFWLTIDSKLETSPLEGLEIFWYRYDPKSKKLDIQQTVPRPEIIVYRDFFLSYRRMLLRG